MTRVRRWLHQKAWRPVTLAILLVGGTAGLALDYASAQREHLCESNNLTISIVQQLVSVTFDEGPPTKDPLAVLNALPEYRRLSADRKEAVLDTLSVLGALSRSGNTDGAEKRLTGYVATLHPEECSGALIFG